MRKMITLIAAAALVASPFAFAEDATNNPNDVMQTVPGQQVADAGTTTTTTTADATPAAEPSAEPAAEPAKPVHHKHHKKHHHKHHHKTSEAPSSDSHMSKEEPTTGSGTDMSAPAAAPTGQ